MTQRTTLLVASLLVAATVVAQDEDPGAHYGLQPRPEATEERPWFGIGWSAVKAPPEECGYELGVVLSAVYEPSASAGLQAQDLLVGVEDEHLTGDEDEVSTRMRELLGSHAPGADVTLVVYREGEGLLHLTVTTAHRPPPFDPYPTEQAWLEPPRGQDEALRQLTNSLLAQEGLEASFEDLSGRLRATEANRDLFRLRPVVQAHVHPFATEAIGAAISRQAAHDVHEAAVAVLTGEKAELPDLPDLGEARSVEELATAIEGHLLVARELLDEALAPLTEEDRQFVLEHLEGFGDCLQESVYLHTDEDEERQEANLRIVSLARWVRPEPLLQAGRVIARTCAPGALPIMQRILEAHPAAGEPIIHEHVGEAGTIQFCGSGASTHKEAVAFRVDLGGNDRYRDAAAAARMGARPISVSIDLAGDDLYGATGEARLAGAVGGIAILVDHSGDDQYLATRWDLGAAILGVAVLEDHDGDDIYRIGDLGQGIAFVGLGALVDRSGDDQYSAHHLAQGVGLGRGLGVLADLAGDDGYVCTGRDPSGYGTAGIFDGWGQGLGMGFRTVTSGGVGVLHDAAGDDRYEGGNFTGGGGYFYGMGILEDGAGRDRYLGSRYSHGFAAHQAVGVMIERGGDDHYQTHHEVAHGLSWDETTVVFHDLGGDDHYEASGFSLSRAAHNGVCLVQDDAGDDVYEHRAGPAGTSGNTYHGGTSLALFLDLGGGSDCYRGGAANDSLGCRGEHAFFLDLPVAREGLRGVELEALERVYRKEDSE